MAYIYVITNDVNGKQYVGKTLQTIERRFKQHIRDSHHQDRPICRAIRKYGPEHFHIEVLEEVNDLDILSEKETQWIFKLKTFGSGYNATAGGDGVRMYDYDLIMDLTLKGFSAKKISEEIGCCADTVFAVRRLFKNDPNYPNLRLMRSKPIDQLDLNNNLIRTFSGIRETSKWMESNGFSGESIRDIVRCAKGSRKSAYGFKWRYHNESDRPSH